MVCLVSYGKERGKELSKYSIYSCLKNTYLLLKYTSKNVGFHFLGYTAGKGGGTYFHWGGGGGKDKKGQYNVKKGTYDAHADNITNVIIKHPCTRSKVSF